MSGHTRIAICDITPAFRIGVKHILELNLEIDVVLETSTTRELLKQQADSQMDIVLAGIQSDDPDSLTNLARFKAIRQDVKLIVLVSCSNMEVVKQSLELGAQGVHHKNAMPSEIIDAVNLVQQGGNSLGSCVTTSLVDHISRGKPEKTIPLSHREELILDLVSKGKSNSDIANQLFISIRTVKYHVSSILAKLDAKNRTEAAMIWTS